MLLEEINFLAKHLHMAAVKPFHTTPTALLHGYCEKTYLVEASLLHLQNLLKQADLSTSGSTFCFLLQSSR